MDGCAEWRPDISREAGALVDEVGRSPPDALLRTSIWIDYSSTRSCGYEPEILTSDPRSLEFTWTYERIRSESARYIGDAQRTIWLGDKVSRFEAEFLVRCMRASVFAPLCRRRATALVVAADERIPPSEQAFVRRNVCTYLDAVAALQGRAVVRREQAD
ncbi:hypothetical protein [Sphingosinithalassobacter sp. CS137]|uniref:hypothetical protein n=1 Tax=Sphingosinithalassobacter sp. CS137 TaxID=2762748 RepID=UPI00165E9E0D|nr:hypothetical protein [Sphingosinithalassobacter sp. CS137]